MARRSKAAARRALRVFCIHSRALRRRGHCVWYLLVRRQGRTWDDLKALFAKPSAPPATGTIETGELSIHFLELGNKYTGDCTLIKIGDTEVLIDAGSRKGSAETLVPAVSEYCTDGVLEYVIATHADQDHIAAFVGTNEFPASLKVSSAKSSSTFRRPTRTPPSTRTISRSGTRRSRRAPSTTPPSSAGMRRRGLPAAIRLQRA